MCTSSARGPAPPTADLNTGTVLCVTTSLGMTGVVIIQSVRLQDGELLRVAFNYIIWADMP